MLTARPGKMRKNEGGRKKCLRIGKRGHRRVSRAECEGNKALKWIKSEGD